MIQQQVYRNTGRGYVLVAQSNGFAGTRGSNLLISKGRNDNSIRSQIYARFVTEDGVALLCTSFDPDGVRGSYISHQILTSGPDTEKFTGIADINDGVFLHKYASDTPTLKPLPVEEMFSGNILDGMCTAAREVFGTNVDLLSGFLEACFCFRGIAGGYYGLCISTDIDNASVKLFHFFEGLLRLCGPERAAKLGYRSLWSSFDDNGTFPLFGTQSTVEALRGSDAFCFYVVTDARSGEIILPASVRFRRLPCYQSLAAKILNRDTAGVQKVSALVRQEACYSLNEIPEKKLPPTEKTAIPEVTEPVRVQDRSVDRPFIPEEIISSRSERRTAKTQKAAIPEVTESLRAEERLSKKPSNTEEGRSFQKQQKAQMPKGLTPAFKACLKECSPHKKALQQFWDNQYRGLSGREDEEFCALLEVFEKNDLDSGYKYCDALVFSVLYVVEQRFTDWVLAIDTRNTGALVGKLCTVFEKYDAFNENSINRVGVLYCLRQYVRSKTDDLDGLQIPILMLTKRINNRDFLQEAFDALLTSLCKAVFLHRNSAEKLKKAAALVGLLADYWYIRGENITAYWKKELQRKKKNPFWRRAESDGGGKLYRICMPPRKRKDCISDVYKRCRKLAEQLIIFEEY